MGKWAARLAELTAPPPDEALTKLPKGGGEGLLSVLAVPFRGAVADFQQPMGAPDPPAELAEEAPPEPDPAKLARLQAFKRRGFDLAEAEELADRLAWRDADHNDRALCLECVNLAGSVPSGWRCGRPRAADVAAQLARQCVVQLSRCPAFKVAPWCEALPRPS